MIQSIEKRRRYMRKYQKKYYRKNIGDYRRITKELSRDFQKWKEFAGPCVKCGNGDARVLEFHHLEPEKKKFNIAWGWYRASLVELIEELVKCVVLCANCHKIEEWENGVWK